MSPFRLGLVELAPDVSGGAATYGRAIRQILTDLSAEVGFELIRFANQSSAHAISGLDSKVVYYQKWKKSGIGGRLDRVRDVVRNRTGANEIDTLPVALKKNSIDLAWFLAPNQVISQVGRTPFVMTVWDLAHREVQGFPEFAKDGSWALRESWYQKNIGRAFHVVTDSVHTGASLERIYGLFAQHWSSAGLPLPGTVQSDTSLASEIEGKYFYYPASFWSHKNHRVLIDALQLVADQNATLVFTGTDEGMEAAVRAYAMEKLVPERVTFLGRVSDEQVQGLISRAHAVVMPTFLGPTNYPPLEALRHGVPVIASDVHHFDSVPTSGLSLLDPFSPKLWAEEISSSLHKRPAVSGLVAEDTQALETLKKIVTNFSQVKSASDFS